MKTIHYISKFIIAIFLIVAAISCNKSLSGAKNKDTIIGNWIYEKYMGDSIVLSKTVALKKNQIGISFKDNNSLLERSNSGWCGTPPIVTSDYEGVWEKSNDIIDMQGSYWGGKHYTKWKILKFYDNKMLVKVIASNYENMQ